MRLGLHAACPDYRPDLCVSVIQGGPRPQGLRRVRSALLLTPAAYAPSTHALARFAAARGGGGGQSPRTYDGFVGGLSAYSAYFL